MTPGPPSSGVSRLDLEPALEHLRMGPAGSLASLVPGRRASGRTGAGIDFARFRSYSPGDDFRAIDWTLYARLGRAYCRQFHAESGLDLHVLVDVSGSMLFGRPGKLEFARRIARALAFVGLRDQDRVGLATFSDRLRTMVPPRRSRRHLFTLLEAIDGATSGGATDFRRPLEEFGARSRSGGLVVVLSDFLSPAGYAEGLTYLLYKKMGVVAVQILSPEELEPRLDDEVELADAEDPELPRLPGAATSVEAYRHNLERRLRELEAFCRRHRIALLRLESSGSFEDVVRSLVRLGLWERVR